MRFAPSKRVVSARFMTRVRAVLCCVSILFVGAGRAGEGDSGAVGDASLRLFYLYAPDQQLQVERLARWQEASIAPRHPFEVIGVAWPRPQQSSQGEKRVPEPVLARAGDGGDYAALVYPDARIHSQGSGSDMERVVRSLSGAGMSTDVDESTWGKIKELFH